MNYEQIEKNAANLIDDHLKMITVDARGLAEARERAAKFLIVQSILATFLKNFEDDLARAVTLRDAQFARGIAVTDGKNITEKKINVANNRDYTDARESQEKLDAFKNWIKVHIKIFEHAHLLFRQHARE